MRPHAHWYNVLKQGDHQLQQADQVTLTLTEETEVTPEKQGVTTAADVQSYRLPLVQAGQEHLSVAGDVPTLYDHHLPCGFDVAERTSLRIMFL